MSSTSELRALQRVPALFPFSALAAAVAAQHLAGAVPCPLCIAQRFAYLACVLLLLLPAALRKRLPVYGVGMLVALAGAGLAVTQALGAVDLEACAISPWSTWLFSTSWEYPWLSWFISAEASCGDPANSIWAGLSATGLIFTCFVFWHQRNMQLTPSRRS